MKILAVDDDPVMLGFVRDALFANGYDAICASGGQEAIDILKQQTFDCAIHRVVRLCKRFMPFVNKKTK